VAPDLPIEDPEHPIPNLGVVDVHGVKKGGGSDLVIVIATPLQGDHYSLSRLLRKIEAYLEFMHSAEFIRESGLAQPNKTRIIVRLHRGSDPKARELLEKNSEWVRSNDATLVIEVPEEQQRLQ
jgi:hypothetical protein